MEGPSNLCFCDGWSEKLTRIQYVVHNIMNPSNCETLPLKTLTLGIGIRIKSETHEVHRLYGPVIGTSKHSCSWCGFAQRPDPVLYIWGKHHRILTRRYHSILTETRIELRKIRVCYAGGSPAGFLPRSYRGRGMSHGMLQGVLRGLRGY